MPSLDVNIVLFDPDLADMFDVRRNSESVGQDGRAVKTPELHEGLYGIIKHDDGETSRADDAMRTTESISIITAFSLRDARYGFQPDVVIWHGEEFLVKRVTPARQFGEGFTKATAVSFRAITNPPAE